MLIGVITEVWVLESEQVLIGECIEAMACPCKGTVTVAAMGAYLSVGVMHA